MSIDSYGGLEVGGYRDYVVTESSLRPAECRFEAHPKDNDGTVPSVFGTCIEEIRAEIDGRYCETYGRR